LVSEDPKAGGSHSSLSRRVVAIILRGGVDRDGFSYKKFAVTNKRREVPFHP